MLEAAPTGTVLTDQQPPDSHAAPFDVRVARGVRGQGHAINRNAIARGLGCVALSDWLALDFTCACVRVRPV